MARYRRNRYSPRPSPAPAPYTPARRPPGSSWLPNSEGPGTDADLRRFSWDEFLADCSRPSPWAKNSSDGLSYVSADWYGGSRTMEDAMALARNGWAEGRAKMAAGLSVLSPSHASTSVHRLDVAGAYPVAAMAAAGDMQCMVDRGDDTATRRIHRIVVNVSTSGVTRPEHIVNRGVALCSIIDAIEAGDDRCELLAFFGTDAHGDGRMGTLVTLKESDQPLEVDRIAFALAHPAMLRRLMFRQVEHTLPQSAFPGYGTPINAPADTIAGSVYFPSMGMTDPGDYSTPQVALARVKEAVAHYGIEIEGSM